MMYRLLLKGAWLASMQLRRFRSLLTNYRIHLSFRQMTVEQTQTHKQTDEATK